MHSGAPAKPVVAVGDLVKVGQLIGEAMTESRVSAPVHASVSGKVKSIDDFDPISGERALSIVISSDGEQAVYEELNPPIVTNTAEFLNAVQNSGVVGLGGAGYPTAPKLSLKDNVKLDYILVNGAECEPYVTSDARTMVDNANDVFEGAVLLMKYINPKQIIICIEDNKPEAIEKLKALTAPVEGISVRSLPSTYPQGERKVLVYNVTGRIVPEGGRLTDVGCTVVNCTTVSVFANYIKTGMPFTHRIVTVDGSGVKNPKNLIVPLGTAIKYLFDYCGGLTDDAVKIIMGGAMMGKAVPSLEMPLIKTTSAILALNEKDSAAPIETACIKCARCIANCPINLMPSYIEDAFEQKNIDMLDKLKVGLCLECGCCAYICPAKRPLAQVMALSKNMQGDREIC
jgi:electron transport complex protein RnfC